MAGGGKSVEVLAEGVAVRSYWGSMSRSARSIRRKPLIAVPLRKHLEWSAPKLEPEDAAHSCATEGQKERPERFFIRSENGSCLRESTDHKSMEWMF